MVGSYADSTGGIAYAYVKKGKGTKPDETVTIPIANFAARVTGQIAFDDGSGPPERQFEIEAYRAGRRKNFMVSAADFARPELWALRELGANAIIFAGKTLQASNRERVREAIQTLSQEVPERRVYGHTGWREIDGQKVYLHAGGAIGAAGAVEGIETDLSGAGLSLALLPSPPQGDELKAAIRSSIALLDLGPSIMAPDVWSHLALYLRKRGFQRIRGGRQDAGGFKSQLAALFSNIGALASSPPKLPGYLADRQATAWKLQTYAAKDMVLVESCFAPERLAN